MLPVARINEVVGVNTLMHGENAAYRRDWANYSLTIKRTGRTVYETASGQKFVTDAGHLLLLREGLSCFIRAGIGECITVEFNGSFSDSMPDISLFPIDRNVAAVNIILDRIEKEWTSKKISYRNVCLSGVYQLLAILEREGNSAALPVQFDRLLQPALKYMERNFNDPDLSNEDLAQTANLSTSYFRKLFKDIFQVSPMRYLQILRIDRAKEQLLARGRTITETSELTGFSSPYYFTNVFKKETGISPTEFIRMNLIGL